MIITVYSIHTVYSGTVLLTNGTYFYRAGPCFKERDLLGLLFYIFLILHPYTYMYLFVLLVPFLKSTVPFLKSTVPFLKVRSSSLKAPAIWNHKCDNLRAKTPITKTNDLRQKRRKKYILKLGIPDMIPKKKIQLVIVL